MKIIIIMIRRPSHRDIALKPSRSFRDPNTTENLAAKLDAVILECGGLLVLRSRLHRDRRAGALRGANATSKSAGEAYFAPGGAAVPGPSITAQYSQHYGTF